MDWFRFGNTDCTCFISRSCISMDYLVWLLHPLPHPTLQAYWHKLLACSWARSVMSVNSLCIHSMLWSFLIWSRTVFQASTGSNLITESVPVLFLTFPNRLPLIKQKCVSATSHAAQEITDGGNYKSNAIEVLSLPICTIYFYVQWDLVTLHLMRVQYGFLCIAEFSFFLSLLSFYIVVTQCT